MQQDPWDGQWIKERQLGRGGQGHTFLVRAASGVPRKGVMKTLLEHKAHDPKARARMFQEVASLTALKTFTGKVPALLGGNTEQHDDSNVQLFFVMEFIEGQTLQDIVKTKGSISVVESVQLALDLCRVMQAAHQEKIFHRDIKPENIIVRSLMPADAVIVDFGLSFNKDAPSTLTETGERMGSRFLTLPEQLGLDEDRRDFRSDLTGICAILFFCLTGAAPGQLRDSAGLAPHRRSESLLANKVPDKYQSTILQSLLDKGLNHEIADRFQSAADLIVRLEEVFKPTNNAYVGQLPAILNRGCDRLRASSRKIQIPEFRKNALSLHAAINTLLTKFNNHFASQSIFSLNFGGLAELKDVSNDHGDSLLRLTVILMVNAVRIQREIHYMIFAKGSECTVYRRISQSEPGVKTIEIESETVVMRFSGNDTRLDATPFCEDIEICIGMSIEGLGKILEVRG